MTDKERDDLLLSIEATQRKQGATLERIENDQQALRADVGILGHRMRDGWEELKNDMPPAVVAAVDRSFGAEQRSLRADVETLKADVEDLKEAG